MTGPVDRVRQLDAETAPARAAVREFYGWARSAIEHGHPLTPDVAAGARQACATLVRLTSTLLARAADDLGQDPAAASLVLGTVAREIALVPLVLRQVTRAEGVSWRLLDGARLVEHAEPLGLSPADPSDGALIAALLLHDPEAFHASHLARAIVDDPDPEETP